MRRRWFALVALPFAAARAQDATPIAHPAVQAMLAQFQKDNAWTLQQQVSICEIPAPPFKETTRGLEMKRRFESLGLQNVRVDSVGNVIAERPGNGTGPLIVLAGHLDTVFPEGTDVTVKQTGTAYAGAGIGDDCRGLAVLLAVARGMRDNKVQTNGTIWFVADVGEEGPGNLRGIRYLYQTLLKNRPAQFISVDGTGIHVTARAVGSYRYKVKYEGPGGHSYGAFGMPNPIHAAGRAIAKLADLQVPMTPKTTFNVGVIEGGTSVNSVPMLGAFELDMRSESAEALAAVDVQARAAIDAALKEEKARWPKSTKALTVKIDTIGIRPADSRQPDGAPLVKTALTVAKAIGNPVEHTGSGSTDANIPMSLGLPGITVGGGGNGTGAHGSEEKYDDGNEGWKGPQYVALLVSTLAGVVGSNRVTP
jgi:acetylornithine deacetylase/succinyl-diaminopimelate desuccinylase-like protein